MTETATYTLDEDQIAVLHAMRADKYLPASCEAIAEGAGMSRTRGLAALRSLVRHRLVVRHKGSYGRIRYDLTSLGAASSI